MKQITQKSVAKYLTFMALVGILLFGARGLTAYAATTVDSGDCGAEGADVTWTLDSDGKLTISGEGKMADYDVFLIVILILTIIVRHLHGLRIIERRWKLLK